MSHNYQYSSCGFCKRNNEAKSVYMSHQLKDSEGNVTCPQLFKYRCELCGSTGKEAHTRSYCPLVTNMSRQPSGGSLGFGSSSSSSSSSSISIARGGMFRNMGKVTNSRYNSAGRLRNNPNHQHFHQNQASGQNWKCAALNADYQHYSYANFNHYQQQPQSEQRNFDHSSL